MDSDDLKPEHYPVAVAAMQEAADTEEYRLFAGRIDKKLLGFKEKAVLATVRAPEGFAIGR